ncbi:MAG TPA: putative Ig domain-containing protein, partial [Candidatus Acidoferrum sp.]|nr:putative Ig domain-containing protein [Candidatus Acidoferrum sp.]
MRSTQWTSAFLMTVFLSMCGCGGGSTPAPTPAPQPPTGLTYSTPAAVYQVGTPISANSPTSSGGAVNSYSVNPSLPPGLRLSSGTGVISGTPTQVNSAKNYVVTASNAAGSVNATLSITV